MMGTSTRIAGFAAAVAVLFALGATAGAALDPDAPESAAEHGADPGRDATHDTSGGHDGHDTGAAHAEPVRGLAIAADGMRLVVDAPELDPGRDEQLRFSIVDDRGATVRDFDVAHESRMHLIVVRRDLHGFQHLHPAQAKDGSWSVTANLPDPGSYRVFADFTRDERATSLAGDLRVDGSANLEPLPAPATTAVSDGGYDVQLDAARARPGAEARLRFTITKDGEAVHVERYLGAGGHLVALREGDLAFLHVHPTEHGGSDAHAHDDSIGFAATFPTAGRYRLFLQFQHEGRVQTVAFTQEVDPE